MTDRVLVCLPDGRWLALAPDAFARALADGAEAVPSNNTNTSAPCGSHGPELLTAEQMQASTGVPASWWLKQARERRIPHALFGRYVRFDLAALARAGLTPAVAPGAQATYGYRVRSQRQLSD